MLYFLKDKIPATYHLIDNPKKLSWLIRELEKTTEFAFDIETNHPTWRGKRKLPPEFVHLVSGVSFAWGRTEVTDPWKPGNAAYIQLHRSDDSPAWGSRQEAVLKAVREILENDVPKIAQNGKFDCKNLKRLLDIEVQNFTFDTMLAHSLLDEDRRTCSHALKSDYGKEGQVIKLGMSDSYLDAQSSLFKTGLESALEHYDPHMRRYSKVPLQVLYPYGCADSDLTLSLKLVFERMLEEEGMLRLFRELVMPLQHALMLMELHGVPLDMAMARYVRDDQARAMAEAAEKIQEISGQKFNVASSSQLGAILFEVMQLAGGKKTKDGKWATDADSMKNLKHPIGDHVLKFRRAEQIHGHYIEPALEGVGEVTNNGAIGWVHPEYWMDSRTGRLKLTDPNLTTLPRPENGGMIVKSVWCTPEDYVLIFKDFSQIELRVIAHMSGEPVWIDGFNQGYDMHAAMAHRIWNLPCDVKDVKKLYPDKRSSAKTVNFGIAYGESDFSLAQRLGITVEEAHHLIYDEYFGAAPVLRQWIEQTHQFIREYGYVINLFGRRRHLPDGMLEPPPGMQWPDEEYRPSCYRDGPQVRMMGIDPDDVLDITAPQLKSHLKAKHYYPHSKRCPDCPHLHSCFVNTEVKYIKGRVSRALRQGVNAPIQGTAVDMASFSLIWIGEELRGQNLDAAPILHIHDELVVCCHRSCLEQVDRIMDYCMEDRLQEFTQLRVPIKVDTGIVQRWSDKHLKEEEEAA